MYYVQLRTDGNVVSDMQWNANKIAWCVQQEALSPDQVEPWCRETERLLSELVWQCLSGWNCEFSEPDRSLYSERFVSRLWNCIYYHWCRLGALSAVPLAQVLTKIQSVQAVPSVPGTSILHDVILAEAMEMQLAPALEEFDRDFMGLVQRVARRTAGVQAESDVENFAAELILPREDAPPRIASYQGGTRLAHWLRVVTVNYCRGEYRRKQPATVDVTQVPDSEPVSRDFLDQTPCKELLGRLVLKSLAQVPAADRLLIKMLVIDGLPQVQLARVLQIHPGNVTRRRQQISQSIWNGLISAAQRSGCERMARECLDVLLGADNREFRHELALLLAEGLQPASPIQEGTRTP